MDNSCIPFHHLLLLSWDRYFSGVWRHGDSPGSGGLWDQGKIWDFFLWALRSYKHFKERSDRIRFIFWTDGSGCCARNRLKTGTPLGGHSPEEDDAGRDSSGDSRKREE